MTSDSKQKTYTFTITLPSSHWILLAAGLFVVLLLVWFYSSTATRISSPASSVSFAPSASLPSRSGNPLSIVLGVLSDSRPYAATIRAAIRESWMRSVNPLTHEVISSKNTHRCHFVVQFLLGVDGLVDNEAATLQQEAAKYGDVALLPIHDSYAYSLITKYLYWLNTTLALRDPVYGVPGFFIRGTHDTYFNLPAICQRAAVWPREKVCVGCRRAIIPLNVGSFPIFFFSCLQGACSLIRRSSRTEIIATLTSNTMSVPKLSTNTCLVSTGLLRETLQIGFSLPLLLCLFLIL